MFLGSLFRLCGFAIAAGLALLLSPQEPSQNLSHRELSVWQESRATVFKGLRRVKADLNSARMDGRRDVFSTLGTIPLTTEAARVNLLGLKRKLEFSASQ